MIIVGQLKPQLRCNMPFPTTASYKHIPNWLGKIVVLDPFDKDTVPKTVHAHTFNQTGYTIEDMPDVPDNYCWKTYDAVQKNLITYDYEANY